MLSSPVSSSYKVISPHPIYKCFSRPSLYFARKSSNSLPLVYKLNDIALSTSNITLYPSLLITSLQPYFLTIKHPRLFPLEAYYMRCFLCLDCSSSTHFGLSFFPFPSLQFRCDLHREAFFEHLIYNMSSLPITFFVDLSLLVFLLLELLWLVNIFLVYWFSCSLSMSSTGSHALIPMLKTFSL